MSQPVKPSQGVDEQKAITLENQVQEKTRREAQQEKSAAEYSQVGNKTETMRVKVYSPYKDYFDSQAISLSAVNRTGPFDILPRHHNFISLLSPCQLVIRALDADRQVTTSILISGGLMHVKAGAVVVFLDV